MVESEYLGLENGSEAILRQHQSELQMLKQIEKAWKRNLLTH